MTVTPSGPLSGWGRYPVHKAEQAFPRSRGDIPSLLERGYLPRGSGRSYGDASLPAQSHVSVHSRGLDRFLSFNPLSGVMDAEAGVTLEAMLRIALPRGFFVPVTPGTMNVSLGGALASNVHGKNHHRVGSLEQFVLEMEVATPSGVFTCSRESHAELFRAALGGYGLTGFITRAKLRLKPVDSSEMDCLRLRAPDLESLFALMEKHESGFEYSVAWLDALAGGKSLGRGMLILGNHAPAGGGDKSASLLFRERRKVKVPFAMPGFLLNRPGLAAFNHAYFLSLRETASGREGFEPFFYPLDRLRDWNLLYGKGGFLQYQCAIPDPGGKEGVAACLRFLSDHGLGAFLSVLKRCGNDEVMLPFCKRGYTLALDIPMRGEKTLRLLDRLDALVLDFRGRVYLTKDARLGAAAFRAMYPEARAWMETVRKFNPDARSDSRMAERLGLWKI